MTDDDEFEAELAAAIEADERGPEHATSIAARWLYEDELAGRIPAQDEPGRETAEDE